MMARESQGRPSGCRITMIPLGMAETSQSALLGLDLQELTALVHRHGQPEYRARQLFDAIYPQRLTRLNAISTIPRAFLTALDAEGLDIHPPVIEKSFASVDGTIRYLMAMGDSETVETVWMPEGDGGEAGDGSDDLDTEVPAENAQDWRRATICVSSQVGCAVNCRFCLTALLGVKRNLTAGEIVGQITAVLSDRKVDLERQRVNIVFMGMGEPFLNYDNFMKAVRLVVELVRGIRCKVNLIALNPGPGIDFATPEQERVRDFQNILVQAGIPAFVRRPRGRDIYAACGQLKRTVGDL